MTTYFIEIKNRLILLWISWISTVLMSYFYKETLLFTIIQQNIFKARNEQLKIIYFIFTDVTEILSVYLKLMTFLNFQTMYAYLIYHTFIFITPALFKLEYLYLKFILQSITTVYLISTILIHYFLLPITWKFFLSFQDLTTNNSFYLHFEAKLIEYFNFYVSFYCSCALYCQLFTLFLLLFNYTTISVQAIKKFKKLFYYLFLVLATFVSPPEVLTQIFVFLIIFIVYEYLILLFLIKLKCNYK